jgi:RNA polymerase sigma-70 factor (ECF subfamily)
MKCGRVEAEMAAPLEFDEIYDRYKRDVFCFAYHLAQDRGEAEDMYQEVWLRAIQHWPPRGMTENLKPWLMTIVINLHRDRLRRKRVRQLFFLKKASRESAEAALLEESGAFTSDPANKAELALMRQKISQAIDRLPEKQRRVFVFKEIEGLEQAEIAALMKIPLGTVKSLLHRAVKRLQRDLAAYNPREEKVKCDVKILSV